MKIVPEKNKKKSVMDYHLLLPFLGVLTCVLLFSACGTNDNANETAGISNGSAESVTTSDNSSDNLVSDESAAAYDDILTEKEENNASQIVMTINGTDLYADEALYYIAYYESYGQQVADYYDSYYEVSDYWDIEQDEEGNTARDIYKANAYNSLYYYTVLAEEAKAAGYTLTEDNNTQIDSLITDFFSDYTSNELALSGMNAVGVRKAFEKLLLASKYSNTILDGITIDEDAVRAGINRSDYVQIETTYLYLSTQSYDENQNAIELTEEETQSYLDIMQEALTMAQNGSSFADIKTALSDDDSFTVTSRNYLSGSTDIEEAYRNAASELTEGELSSIVKGKYGYYIIRMDNTNSDSAYEQAVADAIENAETEAFNDAYAAIAANYSMELNQEYWNSISMGNVTIITDGSASDDASLFDGAGDTEITIGE